MQAVWSSLAVPSRCPEPLPRMKWTTYGRRRPRGGRWFVRDTKGSKRTWLGGDWSARIREHRSLSARHLPRFSGGPGQPLLPPSSRIGATREPLPVGHDRKTMAIVGPGDRPPRIDVTCGGGMPADGMRSRHVAGRVYAPPVVSIPGPAGLDWSRGGIDEGGPPGAGRALAAGIALFLPRFVPIPESRLSSCNSIALQEPRRSGAESAPAACPLQDRSRTKGDGVLPTRPPSAGGTDQRSPRTAAGEQPLVERRSQAWKSSPARFPASVRPPVSRPSTGAPPERPPGFLELNSQHRKDTPLPCGRVSFRPSSSRVNLPAGTVGLSGVPWRLQHSSQLMVSGSQ
jgi:hypothetical protein